MTRCRRQRARSHEGGPSFIAPNAPDHGHAEVDSYWPRHRLVVETDSWRAHGTRAACETDRARDAALQAMGYRVVRFTWRTPDATIRKRLRALLHH